MISENRRSVLLKMHTDDTLVIKELLSYTKNKFIAEIASPYDFNLQHPSIKIWNSYVEEASHNGVFETLKSRLIQFQFPIEKDISLSQEYKNATLKGVSTKNMKSATGIVLNKPQSLQLKIHSSFAGDIPVLIVPNPEDFNTIIRALSYKNEPIDIPNSMGAAIINGINNWDRIHNLKKQWKASHPFENWSAIFKEHIQPYPQLYKDRLIVLSTKPYSNVLADSLNITQNNWLQYSLKIRLEHECTHLFTLKYYGTMTNNIHDELLADYMGIHKILGRFDQYWFLKFIGLENFPEYRKGARLENYLGNPTLSKEAFNILKVIINKAVKNVKRFDNCLGDSRHTNDLKYRLITLSSFDLITIASPGGAVLLLSHYQKLKPLSSIPYCSV